MTLLLDYAWAKPTPAAIKAAGYSGVMRYLSGDATKNLSKAEATKNLSKAEATGLLAAGLSIGLVWETTANRAGQGFGAGAADAVTAEAQANALGYPITAVLFYAVDYDATPAAVASYFAGVTSKAHRPVGVYGGIRIVDGVAAPWKWQACAWSGGRVSTKAHLYQRLHATVAHPLSSTDENVVLHSFPMWTNAPHVDPVTVSRGGWVRPIIAVIKAIVTRKLVVNGVLDLATRKRFQQWANVTQDGVLGFNTWHHVQAKLGFTAPTGSPNSNTWIHLQRLVGSPADGVPGPDTYRHLQTYLNSH